MFLVGHKVFPYVTVSSKVPCLELGAYDMSTLGSLLLDTGAWDGNHVMLEVLLLDTGACDGKRYIRSFTVGHRSM
jgi:hypothetical protein